jgi:aryl-alcohol dehydrogenase-like predicted oxidoreductase
MLDGRTDGHPDLGRDYVVNLIRGAGELGINFIDTAEQYGAGESERRVGLALEGQRDRWIIGTKFGALVGPKGERINDATAKRFPVSLEGSLSRLKTDRIDVYVYHVGPDAREVEGVAREIEKAKKAGKIRASGISGNDIAQFELLRQAGILDVIQYHRNMLEPQEKVVEYIQSHNIGGVVRGAFAGGRLSGKYFNKPPEFAPDDIRSNWIAPGSDAARDFLRAAAFGEMVKPNRTMAQTALRFLLDHPATHTIIPGAKTIEDYRLAVAAADLPPLSAAEHQRVVQLREGLKNKG